jgi:hypothetical protein
MRFRPFSPRVAALVAVVLGVAVLGACEPVKPPKTPPVSGECTQYWRGYVLPGDHNYAGIGAFSGSDRYMCKPTPWQGVRAQVQHLRNYADANSTAATLETPFEPRPKYDEAAFDTFPFKGEATTWVGLNGKWAVPGDTYGQTILDIYNNMRAYSTNLGPVPGDTKIMGPSALTASQIAAYVKKVIADNGLTWKPEITPTQMAQLFINEGNPIGVRGDIAFCQSILETAWFAWPNSPSTSAQSYDPVLDGYFELQQVTDRN